jgi:hypothetical protein
MGVLKLSLGFGFEQVMFEEGMLEGDGLERLA